MDRSRSCFRELFDFERCFFISAHFDQDELSRSCQEVVNTGACGTSERYRAFSIGV